jgi:hypothetical protein
LLCMLTRQMEKCFSVDKSYLQVIVLIAIINRRWVGAIQGG